METFARRERKFLLRFQRNGVKNVKSDRMRGVTATQHTHTLWVLHRPRAQELFDLVRDNCCRAVHPVVVVSEKTGNRDGVGSGIKVIEHEFYWLCRLRSFG